MIKKFSCHNFRNINVDQLEFDRINLLVGPNNSGKSNFIKALTFFSEMMNRAGEGNQTSAFLNAAARNGWEHMLCKHAGENEAIEFDWVYDINEKPFHYRFSFGAGNTAEQCRIILEELSSSLPSEKYQKEFNYFRCHDGKEGQGALSSALKIGQRNKRLTFAVDSRETMLMQFKDILLKEEGLQDNEHFNVEIAQLLYSIQKYFEEFGVYADTQLDINTMNHFAELFHKSKTKDVRWKLEFEKRMRELIPDLKGVDTVDTYDSSMFRLAYQNGEYDLSDVSEGTIRGLILNLLINMKLDRECSVLAIDEPENGLDPAWQKVIGNWIQTADTFRQCFISTHSPYLLDALTDGFKQGNVAVFVFDNDAAENIRKITYEDIADETGEWMLGDLYNFTHLLDQASSLSSH